MRKQIWITCITALAVCLLVVLLKMGHRQRDVLPTQMETPTNQPSQPELSKTIGNGQGSYTSRPPSLPLPVIPPAQTIAKTKPVAAQKLAAWQGSIDFYGKVVDENSNAVSGAHISFRWVEVPDETGNRTAETESDAEGLFALRNQRGLDLGVSVSKEGYYSSRKDNDSFSYGSLRGEVFSPDPRNPVVFHLRKKMKGESLIEKDFPPGIGQIWQLHHDGTPIELDLLNGSQNVTGSGQLKLEFLRDISNKNAIPFDWKLQLSTPNGGLVPTDEEFAFQAPETGYQPFVVIDMPSTNQNWIETLRAKYYVKLPDGKYGRIDFYLLSHNGVFTVHSTINPTGSRNLESAQ